MTHELFEFPPDKYVLGCIDSLYNKPNAAKLRKAIPKSAKVTHDYNSELDFGFFKLKSKAATLKLVECINEYSTIDVPSGILILAPAESIKGGRPRNCFRFNPKQDFLLKYEFDDVTSLSLTYKGEPSAFLFYQTPTR